MTGTIGKSPAKVANDLSTMLDQVLGQERFPVDVAELAKERTKNLEDPITKVVGGELDGFDGMLRHHKKKPHWHIIHNTNTDYPGRERFTLAHEFGHYLLHRKPLSASDFADDMPFEEARQEFSCTPLERNLWSEDHRQREEEADTFASYLLMPMNDYRRQVEGEEITVKLLGHITDRYGVSLTAAIRKWIDFTQMRAAMVVARDGYALWGRASGTALKSGIFVRSGMPIPAGSIAARGPDAQNGEKNQAIQLTSGIWRFPRVDESVAELAMFSNRLGQSISVLLFEDSPSHPVEEEPREWDTYDQFVWRG